jgi:ribonuclease HI
VGKTLIEDTSVYSEFALHDQTLGFRYLGYFLTYNCTGLANCKIIRDRINQATQRLSIKLVHPGWAGTILQSVAHGISRYFTQIGYYTPGGVKNISKNINASMRNALKIRKTTPSVIMNLDRRSGGAGIVPTLEVVHLAHISTLFHSLNCSFSLTHKSVKYECLKLKDKQISKKARNQYGVALDAMNKYKLNLMWFDDAKNKVVMLPKIRQHQCVDAHFPTVDEPTLSIYVDASFDTPWKPAGGAISFRNGDNKLVRFYTIKVLNCESSTTAEIITAIHAILGLSNNTTVEIFVDNETASVMNSMVRCNFAYTRFFWKVAQQKNLNVKLSWVRGHANNPRNTVVDKYAKWARLHGKASDINLLVLRAFPNQVFVTHNGSLAPNLRKIVHQQLQKKLLTKNISNPMVAIDSNSYHPVSFNFWKTSYLSSVARSLYKARWDSYFNKHWNDPTETCQMCNVPATIKHMTIHCPQVAHHRCRLEKSILEILHAVNIKEIDIVWENKSVQELEEKSTCPWIGIRGLIPKSLVKRMRETFRSPHFPYQVTSETDHKKRKEMLKDEEKQIHRLVKQLHEVLGGYISTVMRLCERQNVLFASQPFIWRPGGNFLTLKN